MHIWWKEVSVCVNAFFIYALRLLFCLNGNLFIDYESSLHRKVIPNSDYTPLSFSFTL